MSNVNAWFPLYPGDYLRDTLGLSSCEHGCYLLLLMQSWSRGPLPDDLDRLQRISGNPPMETLRFILETYWDRIDAGWVNRKMEEVRQKQIEHRERLSEAGKRGMAKRWGKDNEAITTLKPPYNDPNNPAITNQSQSQSQNQNQLKDYVDPDGSTTQNSAPKKANSVPYSRIASLWAEVLPDLPQPAKLSDARKATIRARWNDELPDLDAWRECFEIVKASKFLTGRTQTSNGRKPFRATLDWVAKEENLLKIYEGKYSNG